MKRHNVFFFATVNSILALRNIFCVIVTSCFYKIATCITKLNEFSKFTADTNFSFPIVSMH